MTEYFRGMARLVSNVHLAREGSSQLQALEEKLVRDVAFCAEMPGFPEALKVRLHTVLSRESPYVALEDRLQAWKDTDIARKAQVLILITLLQELFQELGAMNLPGFTDDPLAPIHYLETRGQRYRQAMMMEVNAGVWRDVCTCKRPTVFREATTTHTVDGVEYQSVAWLHACDNPECDSGGGIYSWQALALGECQVAVQMLARPGMTPKTTNYVRRVLGMTREDAERELGEGYTEDGPLPPDVQAQMSERIQTKVRELRGIGWEKG